MVSLEDMAMPLLQRFHSNVHIAEGVGFSLRSIYMPMSLPYPPLSGMEKAALQKGYHSLRPSEDGAIVAFWINMVLVSPQWR
tara:strand:- start:1170 stop:1415 length:246 start_codon:yes stop_codon:yes gene_type:complete